MDDVLNFLLQPLFNFINYSILEDGSGSSLVTDLKQLIEETIGKTGYILMAIFTCLLFLNALMLATVVCFYQEFQRNCNEAFSLFYEKNGRKREPPTCSRPKIIRYMTKSDTEIR